MFLHNVLLLFLTFSWFICHGCTAAPSLFIVAALQPLVYLLWLHCSPYFIYYGCTAAFSLFVVATLQPLPCLSWLHCSQTTHEWHYRSDCIALL